MVRIMCGEAHWELYYAVYVIWKLSFSSLFLTSTVCFYSVCSCVHSLNNFPLSFYDIVFCEDGLEVSPLFQYHLWLVEVSDHYSSADLVCLPWSLILKIQISRTSQFDQPYFCHAFSETSWLVGIFHSHYFSYEVSFP
jgi:hypothetical protein